MPSQHVRILLTTCKWDKEKLLERYLDIVVAMGVILAPGIMQVIKRHSLLKHI